MGRLCRISWALLSLGFLLPALPCPGRAAEEVRNIGGMELVVSREGFANCWQLFDADQHQAITVTKGSRLTLRCGQGFGSAYLIFDEESGPYTVTEGSTGESRTFGEQGFLHEFLDLEDAFGTAPQILTLSFPNGDARLNELYLFPPGQVPDFIQKWESPKEGKTDLMLFSTHGDDEQLFFAGLLPYYAGELGYEVLVAYLTDHCNCTTLRRHEMLDGLWAVGVRTYPVLGPFPDHYSRSKDRAYALCQKDGLSEEDLLGYVVEQLRRYRPQVAVGHDAKGEYGHGQHMMYSELLRRGVEIANDPAAFPETAARWGTWDTPKTYLHLWPENTITMDYDQPLPHFDGMTAFQVSQQLGFPCHKSQYWGFAWYIAGFQRAADIPQYNPCQFGLCRTTIGPDTGKQDMFENLVSYADQEAIAQAITREKAALRQLRASASDALQTQLLAREEAAAANRLRLEEKTAARRRNTRNILIFGTLAVIMIPVSVLLIRRKTKEK